MIKKSSVDLQMESKRKQENRKKIFSEGQEKKKSNKIHNIDNNNDPKLYPRKYQL